MTREEENERRPGPKGKRVRGPAVVAGMAIALVAMLVLAFFALRAAKAHIPEPDNAKPAD